MTGPTLAGVVGALDALGVRYWRWPGDHLGLWPPVPAPLAAGVRAHKPALLDLADARGGRDTPAWARTPDGEGWYRSPGGERVRFPAQGGYQLRGQPGGR